MHLHTLSFALFPPTCILCLARGQVHTDLCADCERDLPRPGPVTCRVCGVSLAAGTTCGTCITRPPAYRTCRAGLRYAWPVDALVLAFKESNDRAAATVLARFMPAVPADIDLVVPVPLHPRRLRERGFNQAEVLARQMSRPATCRIATGIARRVRETADQKSLPLAGRARNLRRAFAVDGALDGARVLVVDDVVTSGATVNELALALRRAGAGEVDVACLARAERQP